MTYKETPIKTTSKEKQTLFDMRGLGTWTIIWFLTKRHKFGLVMTWAIVMTALVAVPQLPTIIRSL